MSHTNGIGILIPEHAIKKELEILLLFVWNEYNGFLDLGDVVDATQEVAGSQVAIAVTQQGSAGTPEITRVTFQADANKSYIGKYWFINTPSTKYYIWYKVDGEGDDPKPDRVTHRTGIMIEVAENDTANTVATKHSDILGDHRHFTVPIPGGVFIDITNNETDQIQLSFIFEVFGGIVFDKMDYFEQMVEILRNRFVKENRKLEIHMGYLQGRADFPNISIVLPMETNSPKEAAIAQGYHFRQNNTTSYELNHNFQVFYQLLITSDSQNEVLLIYHFLKTLILAGIYNFTAAGLQNLVVSGRDLAQEYSSIAPVVEYHRSVGLDFYYDNTVPSISRRINPEGATFTGTPTS